MNLDLLPRAPTSSELDGLIEALDQALDAAFLGELETALARPSAAGAGDPQPAAALGTAG